MTVGVANTTLDAPIFSLFEKWSFAAAQRIRVHFGLVGAARTCSRVGPSSGRAW